MKKIWITIVFYLGILLVCMGILFVIHKITDLEPGLPIEQERAATPAVPEAGEFEELPAATPGEAGTETLQGDQKELEVIAESKNQRPFWYPPQEQVPEEEEPPLPVVVFATDLHVLSPSLMDEGPAFWKKVSIDDGKLLPYHHQILDAFIEEVMELAPDVLVLSGDLTLDGERASHLYLAERLKAVQDAGIQVLAMPGNHDINNVDARVYLGEQAEFTDYIDEHDFREIYREYGYRQAFSQDPDSLSYLYQLREDYWLMILDSNHYIPRNRVSGKIRPETFEWMKEQFAAAAAAGAVIIPTAHHNLLEESRLYVKECVIENNDAAIWLFEEWQVPIFFSGHLHAQRVKKYFTEPGMPSAVDTIYEIVNSPLTMPPCQYGILKWQQNGSMDYQLRQVNVEQWARRHGSENEDLLHFDRYQEAFFAGVIGDQIRPEIKNFSEQQTEIMVDYYVGMLRSYVEGKTLDTKTEQKSEGYRTWERNLPDHQYFREINEMLKDSGGNHKEWSYQYSEKETKE